MQTTINKTLKYLIIVFIVGSFITINAAAQETVKVFILAGQSNMEGKADNKLLEYQANQDSTKTHYTIYRKDDKWIVRDDVSIKYLRRYGPLTIGYGSPSKTGPELAFGTIMGEHYDEPVILIKTAWGGHSLYRNFRPPSAGLPSEADLKSELKRRIAGVIRRNKKHNRNDPLPTMLEIRSAYGASYRMMLDEVRQTLKDYKSLFPELKRTKLALSGFVWFQGWNDQYDGVETEYASNMKHFIQDVRKDLKSPQLPFVIGIMGQNGHTPAKGAMKVIQEAQKSMESIPEFRGNVKSIRTDLLEDKAAAAVEKYQSTNKETWSKAASNGRYHYLGSGIWFNRIGKELAKGMLDIVK